MKFDVKMLVMGSQTQVTPVVCVRRPQNPSVRVLCPYFHNSNRKNHETKESPRGEVMTCLVGISPSLRTFSIEIYFATTRHQTCPRRRNVFMCLTPHGQNRKRPLYTTIRPAIRVFSLLLFVPPPPLPSHPALVAMTALVRKR